MAQLFLEEREIAYLCGRGSRRHKRKKQRGERKNNIPLSHFVTAPLILEEHLTRVSTYKSFADSRTPPRPVRYLKASFISVCCTPRTLYGAMTSVAYGNASRVGREPTTDDSVSTWHAPLPLLWAVSSIRKKWG